MALTVKIGCKAEQTGIVSVPAKILLETLQSLQSEKIMLSGDEQKLEIAAAGAEIQIQAMPADEFPAIPTINSPNKLTFSRDIILDAFAKVAVAASLDESRPVLAGVHMRIDGDKLVFAATDSYRLAESRVPSTSSEDISVIMPLRTVQEVLRLAGSSDSAKISFDLGKTEARISIDNIELVTRLIEGNFPNYAQIIPSKSASTLKVSRSELIQAARLTGIFARESANTIIIKASDSKLTLHAEAAQIGENTSEVSLKLNGDEATISLNVRFLIDALNVISSDEVELRLNDKLDPCVVVPSGKNTDYIHLIMPLRS
jgi:DNA polymerase-3 subunit beta